MDKKTRRKQFACLWTLNNQSFLLNHIFSRDELAFLFVAATYLHYQSAVIYNEDGHIATRADMADLLSCSVATVKRMLADLVDKNVVKYYDRKYHLNPEVAWKGLTNVPEYTSAKEFFIVPNDVLKEKTIVANNLEGSKKPSDRRTADKYGHKTTVLRGSQVSRGRVTGEPPKAKSP